MYYICMKCCQWGEARERERERERETIYTEIHIT
jgi:hypothetical protein